MVDIIYWIKAYFTETAEGWVASLKSLILRVIISLIILIILLWISVFFYGSFYYLYMPTISYSKPVFFQFRPALSENCDAVSPRRDTGDYLCSFPRANMTLISNGREQLMAKGQTYRITLELDMPESPMNQEMGMFLVKADFYTKGGIAVKSAQRSAILRYRSLILQALETVCLFPFFMSGTTEQKQLVTVELFNSYMEDAFKPAIGIFVEVQSFKIQLYSAVLKIHATFTGLRYMMHHWPALSAFIGISSNMFFLLTIAFFSWFRFLWTKTEGPHLERMDSRRVLFDQALPEEERRRNIQEMLQKEEEEAHRSSRSSSSSSSPETIQASPLTKSSLDEDSRKSSSEDDTVVISKKDLESESGSTVRLRQTPSSTT